MASRVNKRTAEFESENEIRNNYEGVSRATPNTINGKWAENRGRRGGEGQREENPFENGELSNWNRRSGQGPRNYRRQDTRIHDDVCDIMTRDRELDASQVEVNVDSGVVTLTGKVEDRSMKKYAGHIIEFVPGVKDIHNLLEFDRR